ncbi:MAG TPA: DUF327 family protein [Geobacteraceae bacterium]|nr:DUF327 family protein [Geobacteraceae bacterium]
MRISESGRTRFEPGNNRIIVIRNSGPTVFSRELTRQEEKILDVDRLELDDLREELQDVGDLFENRPTIMNYRAFREAMGRFAKKAISVAYRLEKKPSNRPTWAHEIIMVIDRAADELLNLVMQDQHDRIRIASKMASIKGMIVRISI